MKTGRYLILLSILAAIGQGLFYWPRLPATLASHFGPTGQANGWQSKPLFFVFYFFIVLLLALIFIGMPLLIRRMPVNLINLPNKDYWLAPERRDESLSFLQNQLELTGAAALLLIVVVMQMAISTNLNKSSVLPTLPTELALALFIGVELTCMVRLITHFSVRTKAPSSD